MSQNVRCVSKVLTTAERKKLALGRFYESLKLSDEDAKQVKNDIIAAKKYEKDMLESAQKRIEAQVLKKLLDSTDPSKDKQKLSMILIIS